MDVELRRRHDGDGNIVQHTYSAAGTFPVTLTVTDDDGATDSSTQQVEVTDALNTGLVARDTFNRSVTGGLGVADVGGEWTVGVGGTRQSVRDGVAELGLPAAGNNTGSYLGGVSSASTDLRTSFALSAMPTGAAGTYVYVTGRRVSTGNEYRARVRVAADGRVFLALSRLVGGAGTYRVGRSWCRG